VLGKLGRVVDPRVLVSSNTADDAGVYLMGDGSALVLTVDFFTPIVDDPRDYGRIAAANAVSDVYAMGGTPLVALNVLCFPDEQLSPDIMVGILAGAQEKMAEAGVVVIGGHSVKDDELKFGCSVVGTIDPAKVVTNAGAVPGDVLVLTTDVTGFGLVGHAAEMAEGSDVTLEIEMASVPLIDGALKAVRDGLIPAGLANNREYYRSYVAASSGIDSYVAELLYDPQTSGGLLIALPEDRVAAFEAALAAKGGESWIVGKVLPRSDRPLAIV